MNTPTTNLVIGQGNNEDLSYDSEDPSSSPTQVIPSTVDKLVEPSYNLAKKRQELINKTHLILNKRSLYQKRQIRKNMKLNFNQANVIQGGGNYILR